MPALAGSFVYGNGHANPVAAASLISLHENKADTLSIEEVTVSGQRSPDIYSGLSRIVYTFDTKAISRMPANNLQGILEYAVSLDIRQRGSHGVQADISMRGGSFEQVLVLLNGVRVNDPQTGHHNLNLPLNTADIERIEILKGPGSRIYGPNAFSGAVNIITKEPGNETVKLSVQAGEYGYTHLLTSGGFKSGPLNHYISIGNQSSAGFADNTDFNISNVFYRTRFDTGPGNFDLQAGYLDKGFGASNFYSSLYPEQYEKISSSFTSLSFSTGSSINLTQSAYWRRHTDRFELFRYDAAPWYGGHNFHLTDIYGTGSTLRIPFSYGSMDLGAELKKERIYSTILGEKIDTPRAVRNESIAVYDHYKDRNEINITAGGTVILERIAVSSGMLLSKTGSSGWGLYGGVDLNYTLTERLNLFASWNQSHRIPTFTEMYYHGPVHRGNPGIKPEKGTTTETGIRFIEGTIQGHAVLFSRKGTDMIDWAKKEDELVWESRNISEIDTYGTELELSWKRPDDSSFPVGEFRMGYSYLDISRQSEEYISAYILDHLKQKFITGITLPVYRSAEIVIMAVFQDRAGTYTDTGTGHEVPYDPFILADIGTSFLITGTMSGSVSISNLFNTYYSDIGNVPVPGRWIKAGLGVEIPFKR